MEYKIKKWQICSRFACKIVVILFALLGSIRVVEAQSLTDRVTVECHNEPLASALKKVEKASRFKVLFTYDEVQGYTVSIQIKNKTIEKALSLLLQNKPFKYSVNGKFIHITQTHTQASCISDNQSQDVFSGNQLSGRNKIVIQGKVLSKTMKDPLPGVTVFIKGTSEGTQTNLEGIFRIETSTKHPILQFTYAGMKPLTMTWRGEEMLRVMMEDDVSLIDEVVVTGYQRIRKSEMVGSANTVQIEDLFYDGHRSIEQMLQGKLSGTSVLNTSGLVGSTQRVRVRGTSTLLGNQEPVWVVDGIIQEDPLPFKTRDLDALGNITQDNFDMIKNFVGNSISWLSPNDIKTISVLKDASATVMYGVKAANGVIVITTKQGKSGRVSINYSGGFSISPRIHYSQMNLMNSSERIDVSSEIYRRGLISEANRPLERIGYEGLLGQYLRKEINYQQFADGVRKARSNNTDWFKELFRNSISYNHSVSISGGSDNINYYASLNGSFTNGISKGNDSKNYSASVSIDTKFSNKVSLSVRLNAASHETHGFFRVNPYYYARTINRAIPAYNDDGSLFYYTKTQDTNRRKYNIINELNCTGNINTTNTMALSANLRWMIFEGLRFEGLLGYNISNVVGESYADEQSFFITNLRGYEFGLYGPGDLEYKKSRLPHGGELNTTESRNKNYTLRATLSYNKILNNVHRLSFMAGGEMRSNKYDGYNTTVYGYFRQRGKSIMLPPRQVVDPLNSSHLIANDLYDNFSNSIIDRKINNVGIFATSMYSYDERYILSASIRSDASNRFGQDERNRFLPVWSVGARWNIINEPWMKNVSWISDFNVRASYGWQGNVVENYGPDLIAELGRGRDFIDTRTGRYILKIKSLPYDNLRWEKTKSINLGIDFGVLKNRIAFSAEYYLKHTSDMIVSKAVPYEYGVLFMPINGGSMTNRGFEFTASITPIRTKDWVWSFSMNTAKNFNEIQSTIAENQNWRAAAGGSVHKKGYPVGSFWVWNFAGLDPQGGYPLFNIPTKEEGANPLDATTYMTYAGTTEPDFSGGMSTVLRWKTLTLSASFSIALGGKRFLTDLFDEDYLNNSTPSAYSNLSKDMVKRWQKPGDELHTQIPTIPHRNIPLVDLPNGSTEYRHRMYNYSTARVVNASFLRCNNISLSYTVPTKIVNKMALKNLSISGSVSNPFIVVSKDYNGVDPEVATGSQPITPSYSLTLNFSL